MTTLRVFGAAAVSLGLWIGSGANAAAETLDQGLDDTSLVWVTGGNQPWYATNVTAIAAFDGTDAAASGPITHNQESWLETTVTGPGTLTFWWSVSSEVFNDVLEFRVDGQVVDAISGDQFPDWQYRIYYITNGSHTVRWRYFKDTSENSFPDRGYLDQVKFITTEIPLGTALNAPYWAWWSGGNANPTYWSGQTNVFRTDGVAAESGGVTRQQASWMEAVISGVTNVSFWWKVSSEEIFDNLLFSVDGTNQFSINGETGWLQQSNIVLTPGLHTLRWTYTNDDSVILGMNRGWVDEVKFLPSNAPAPILLSAPVLQPDGHAQFNLNYELGRSVEIQYATNLAAPVWNVLLRTNLLSTSIPVTDPGATNSPVHRFYRAKAP